MLCNLFFYQSFTSFNQLHQPAPCTCTAYAATRRPQEIGGSSPLRRPSCGPYGLSACSRVLYHSQASHFSVPLSPGTPTSWCTLMLHLGLQASQALDTEIKYMDLCSLLTHPVIKNKKKRTSHLLFTGLGGKYSRLAILSPLWARTRTTEMLLGKGGSLEAGVRISVDMPESTLSVHAQGLLDVGQETSRGGLVLPLLGVSGEFRRARQSLSDRGKERGSHGWTICWRKKK